MKTKHTYNTSNIYVTKTGRIEHCRKQEKGQHCSRHNPAAKHDYAKIRVIDKLTPFERRIMKALSLISKTPLSKIKNEYSSIVAEYSISGVRQPTSNEVKGLKKLFLELAEESPDGNTGRMKRWLKNATLGESFTSAGFWGLRDILHRSLGRVKNFLTGGILASTLFLTSCAPGATPAETSVVTELEEPEEKFEFDEEYAEFMVKNPFYYSPYGWSGLPEGVFNYSINSIEEDEFGKYVRVKATLPDKYINSIPLVYSDSFDGSPAGPIEDISEQDMREALRFYTDFVLNETLDSIVLDNPYRYEEWLDTTAVEYFTPQLLNEAKKSFKDPLGYDGYLDDDELLGPLIDEHEPPYGDRLFLENVTPGLLHDSGFGTELMIDESYDIPWIEASEPMEGYDISWGAVSKPMIRDGGSRNGVRHIHEIAFEKIGTGAIPTIYIRSKFHLRNLWDIEDVKEHVLPPEVAEFYAKDKAGTVGYTLVKRDGEWKINGYSVQTSAWDPRSAYGDDAFDKYPEWSDSKWLERPELRYPEVTG